MIESFQYINKAFESKVRLGIMAVLMVNEEADFNFLREQLAFDEATLPVTPVPWKNWDISFSRTHRQADSFQIKDIVSMWIS